MADVRGHALVRSGVEGAAAGSSGPACPICGALAVEDKEGLAPPASASDSMVATCHPPTERGGENLRRILSLGLEFLSAEIDAEFEQAIGYFLFASLQ
ncbi:hypothetical protein [Frankia canadensis]|nr:hypothetical protein [Frankia canadensis]